MMSSSYMKVGDLVRFTETVYVLSQDGEQVRDSLSYPGDAAVIVDVNMKCTNYDRYKLLTSRNAAVGWSSGSFIERHDPKNPSP